jgi:hypothetical protein
VYYTFVYQLREAYEVPDWRLFTIRFCAVAGAGFNLVVGLWALIAPQSFYDSIAVFPPFSQHFLHDIGVFQFGIGLVVLLALRWSDALTVTLVAGAVSSVLHLVSHVMDRNIGGRGLIAGTVHPSDYIVLGVVALALALAAVLRIEQTSRRAM